MTSIDNLEPGDYLYQANDELFLAVTEVNKDEVQFAVHGWRTIDKDRLSAYLSADRPVLHTEEQVHEVVEDVDDPDAEDKLQWLEGIFKKYEERDVPDDSAHEDFSMEDK